MNIIKLIAVLQKNLSIVALSLTIINYSAHFLGIFLYSLLISKVHYHHLVDLWYELLAFHLNSFRQLVNLDRLNWFLFSESQISSTYLKWSNLQSHQYQSKSMPTLAYLLNFIVEISSVSHHICLLFDQLWNEIAFWSSCWNALYYSLNQMNYIQLRNNAF